MATAPVLDPIESRSIEQDAATLGFQRLEGVRTRQRARRRRRLILGTALVVALAGVGVLGFAFERDRRGHAQPSVRADTPVPPAAPVATTRSPISPPPALAQPRADEVQRVATPSAPSRVGRPRDGATTSARGEPGDADPTAAIDWLLKTSQPAGR
jgi:hypothetical protein